ncbi:hypothetical protein T492DRAFT_338895 [Pavlovales sp. CCMP2436]|nr:hypothetical protein T492DRAFT_338895 [Pavlovales sp. CCMP2436]
MPADGLPEQRMPCSLSSSRRAACDHLARLPPSRVQDQLQDQVQVPQHHRAHRRDDASLRRDAWNALRHSAGHGRSRLPRRPQPPPRRDPANVHDWQACIYYASLPCTRAVRDGRCNGSFSRTCVLPSIATSPPAKQLAETHSHTHAHKVATHNVCTPQNLSPPTTLNRAPPTTHSASDLKYFYLDLNSGPRPGLVAARALRGEKDTARS